jgi:hypothetical protein
MTVSESQTKPYGYSWQDRKVMFIFLLLLVIFPIGGYNFVANDNAEKGARDELLAALATSSGVIIDGQVVADPTPVLAALRGVRHVPAHHSGPTTPVRLELTGGPHTVAVTIARDSENRNEFWVFRPGENRNNNALGQDAGRVVSDTLDAYLNRRGL